MPVTRAILAACLTAIAAEPAAAARFDVLYTFQGGTDGARPASSLTIRADHLFGTTSAGGNTGCQTGVGTGCGTAYSIDLRTGAETILHVFSGGDGAQPTAGLTWFDGTLYGATSAGGSAGYGAVFSMNPVTGEEHVLYNAAGSNGESPSADLTVHAHQLFGATYSGGLHSKGLAFEIDPATNAYRDIYDLGGQNDSAYPLGALTFIGGVAYGTSFGGGQAGFGSVYALDIASGREKLLHSFQGSSAAPVDGRSPIGALVLLNGQLYGTTRLGGTGVGAAGTECGSGCGTVYRLDPQTGAETVVYNFTGGADGGWPSSGLTVANGTLYGTGLVGGDTGYGVVFSVNPRSGVERVLHSFSIYSFGPPGTPNTRGGEPVGALLYHGNYLYGTTLVGGQTNSDSGYGTVFRLHP